MIVRLEPSSTRSVNAAMISTAHRYDHFVMLSTLPDLPGYTFQVRGLVMSSGDGAFGDKEIPKMLQAVATQAAAMGGNAVIDVKVTRIGERGFTISGTAVAATAAQ